MKRLIIAIVALAALATVAAAKPAPPPSLGVPHEVVVPLNTFTQEPTTVLCPAGEVAVSITFSEPGPFFHNTFYVDPITDVWSGEPSPRPNGYLVYAVSHGEGGYSAHLLCAPVNS